MEFRTPVAPLKGLQGLITHSTPILLLGSCFAENIGVRMGADLFDVTVNPLGTIYSPLPLLAALEGPDLTGRMLVEAEGRVHHFGAHSRLSCPTAEETLASIAEADARLDETLRRAEVVIITLGTTRYFAHRELATVVANCHKQPAACFDERRLTLEETSDTLRRIVESIDARSGRRPHIIFTVSPVRYLGEGAHANQLSKATLLLGVDELAASLPGRITYFPAYEILMDDLRDYRFYAPDMKHPSEQAADYVYQLFGESFFTAPTMELARECRRLTARLAHRPLDGSKIDVDSLASPLISRHPSLAHNLHNYLSWRPSPAHSAK